MKYIAYGSNINLRQMAYRCPNSKVIGTGYIEGWKLYFNYHADISYTNNSNDIVPVLIWDIADEDWENLDMYEGFPNYYTITKIKTNFLNESGAVYKTEKCIAYIMTDRKIQNNMFSTPDDGYVEIIIEGYLENNMDIEYIFQALDYSHRKQAEIIKMLYEKGLY